jgi:hypothetical protein
LNNNDERQRRRERRKRRRLVAISGFLLLSLGMAWFFESQATTTVIVTRHAEQAVPAGINPQLSREGKRRSFALARVLGTVDVVSGIDVILIADTKRSGETVGPLAMRSDAPVITVDDPEDTEALVKKIIYDYKGKVVLVVIDPQLIQPLIADMQGSKKLPEIKPDEYDNLYIVSIPWFGKVKTLRLKYGRPYLAKPPEA